MRTCLLAFALVGSGCGGDAASEPDAGPPERQVVIETEVDLRSVSPPRPPGSPPERQVVIETEVDGSGLSPGVTFAIPADTRSVTVVIEGDNAGLYALGAFALGDGVDRVGLPGGDPGDAMQTSYNDEQIGQIAFAFRGFFQFRQLQFDLA